MKDFSFENLHVQNFKHKTVLDTIDINAAHGGDDVGVATVILEPEAAYLSHVEVNPGFRGKGVGSLLIKRAVDLGASEPGVMSIHTYAQNERTVSAFCNLFDLRKLEYWIAEFIKDDIVEKPVDSDPELIIDYLARERLETFADSPNPAETTDMLSTGVGIRAHLL